MTLPSAPSARCGVAAMPKSPCCPLLQFSVLGDMANQEPWRPGEDTHPVTYHASSACMTRTRFSQAS